MDELYIESFSSKPSEVALKNESPPLMVEETKLEDPPEKPLVEIYETSNQMSFYLDQLEKALIDEIANFSRFQFILNEIRAKLKLKQTEGIYEQLTELEELLDLVILTS